MLFAFRLVTNCVRGVSPPCTKGILEQGGANGLKFTLDCPMLSFPLIFFFLECVSSYVDEFVSFGKEVCN